MRCLRLQIGLKPTKYSDYDIGTAFILHCPKKKKITVHAVTLVTLLKQGKIHLREALKNKLYKIVKLRTILGKLLANFHPAPHDFRM